MREELIKRLREQAAEIAKAGHNGWGNTMLDAASALEVDLSHPPADDARVADEFKPEWANYRQGRADGEADAQERIAAADARVAELEAQLAVERSAYEVQGLLVKAGHERIAALEAQLAELKDLARKASSAVQMIPAAPDGRLPHIGAAIRYLNEIAGLGSAALVTMPIACAQCGEEHQNNTKEAWAIIQLGCCIKCGAKQAQQSMEQLTASREREGRMREAVRENHQWHLDYDEFDGYKESALYETNMAALAAENGEKE